VRHIVVAERYNHATGQLCARIDTCMRQFIDQNQPIAPDQDRNDPGIREVARPKNTGSFRVFELGKAGFELRVERVISGYQTRRAGARPIFLDRRDRCLFDERMLGEVEIVIARPFRSIQMPSSRTVSLSARYRRRRLSSSSLSCAKVSSERISGLAMFCLDA